MGSRVSARKRVKLLLAVAATLAVVVAGAPAGADPRPDENTNKSAQYQVVGPKTWADANAVAQTGAAVDAIEHGRVYVTATPAEVLAIQKLGFTLKQLPPPAADRAATDGAAVQDFPPSDSNFHNYAEMVAELQQIEADHPTIADLTVIGTSFQGRNLYALKISDNVATDENEPEVLYNHHQHAREHLTVEMALYLANMYTNDYGSNTQVTNVVNSREIWILPDVNPDGG